MEWLVRTLNKSQTVLSVDKDKYFVIFSKKEPYKKYRTKKLLSTLKYYEKETARLNKQLSEVQTYKKETEKDLADIKKL
jgi:septal ring factor EnvC (AmiA/AmiB activator)